MIAMGPEIADVVWKGAYYLLMTFQWIVDDQHWDVGLISWGWLVTILRMVAENGGIGMGMEGDHPWDGGLAS